MCSLVNNRTLSVTEGGHRQARPVELAVDPTRQPMHMHALILFAHGARDAEWAKPFHRIRALVQQRRPEIPVALAYLEFMRPNLSEATAELAAAGATDITIVPLFMAQGGHLREDVPKLVNALREQHTNLTLRITTPIGDVESILHSIADWICSDSVARDDR